MPQSIEFPIVLLVQSEGNLVKAFRFGEGYFVETVS